LSDADTTPLAAPGAELALFPLGTVLYPGGPLPLRIFEPRYVDLVKRCTRDNAPFGVVLIREGAEAGPVARIAEVGTSARIVDFYALADGLLGLYCLGERRFRVLRRWQQEDGLHLAEVTWFAEEPPCALPAEHQHLAALLTRIIPELGELYEGVAMRPDDAAWVSFRLAELLPISPDDKQSCLELEDPLVRLARLGPLVRRTRE
jgi:Lon protease-like protein